MDGVPADPTIFYSRAHFTSNHIHLPWASDVPTHYSSLAVSEFQNHLNQHLQLCETTNYKLHNRQFNLLFALSACRKMSTTAAFARLQTLKRTTGVSQLHCTFDQQLRLNRDSAFSTETMSELVFLFNSQFEKAPNKTLSKGYKLKIPFQLQSEGDAIKNI